MTAGWTAAVVLTTLAAQAPDSSRITGTVRDVQGYPVPGATVTIASGDKRAELVSDPAGAFKSAAVPPGRYAVTITMPGFRSRVEQVLVHGDRPVPPLDVTLDVAPLVSILWVVPQQPVSASDVIAHVRIARTAAPAACGAVVTATHEVEVVTSLKGSPGPRVLMAQEGAGVCLQDGRRLEGSEQTYRTGQEFVVFLRENGASFGRLAGPSLTFPVVGGRVTTRGFGGLPAEVTVAAFRDSLQKAF